MAREERKLEFLGRTLEELRALPEPVRRGFGYSLSRIQFGETPDDAKALKGFRLPVMELSIRFDSDTYRTVYTAKLKSRVYVLHIFQKKSKQGIKIPPHDHERIRTRLNEAITKEAEYDIDEEHY